MKNIFTRISDIITSNINALIDQAENPEIMIIQIIREMEENICISKQDVTKAIAAEKRLEKELHIQQTETEKWLRRAEAGIKIRDDDIARTALVRKHEHEKTAGELTRSLCSARQSCDALKLQLKGMCRKLDEAKRKSISLKVRQRAAVSRTRISNSLERFQKTNDIQCDFNRMASKIMDMEACAEAITELNNAADDTERQFDMMEINIAVEDELAVLKEKISPASMNA